MKLEAKKTFELTRNQIEQIVKLKNSHWNFGYNSQSAWFKKNVMSNDFHVMMTDDEVIGYTFLGNRSLKIYNLKKLKKKLNYTLFATLIFKKKYRNYYNVSQMMKLNSKIILKKKNPSFLLCHDEKLNFYKFFGWSNLNKSKFIIPDHKSNKPAMVYNFAKLKHNNNNFFSFYYYS